MYRAHFDRLHFTFVVALGLMLVMIAAAQAGDKSADEPDEFLQSFGDRAIAVLADTDASDMERRQKLEVLLRDGFSLARISKLALGRHWRSATDEERKAFASLFEDYIIDTYDRRLSAYSGQQIVVTGWEPAGKKGAMVSSRIEGSGAPVDIGWRVEPADDGWRIVDVVVEGVSMLITQRNEFSTIIERNGGQVAALIDHLRSAVTASNT